MSTLGDAISYLSALATTQVDKAALEGAPLNVQVTGDSIFRKQFYGMLPAVEQRRFFLNFMASPSNYGRLGPLFGAPPYSFLQAGDCEAIRPAGISFTRRRMVSKTGLPNFSKFGVPTFSDPSGRSFKIFWPGPLGQDTQIGAPAVFSSQTINLFVKLPKRGHFPMPGSTLVLTETASARNFRQGGIVRVECKVQVNRVAASGGARTGCLRVSRIH